MEAIMRRIYPFAFAASLFAAPVMAQVIVQTPNSDSAYHQQRAAQDRAAAHAEHQQAQMDAAMGNYAGAAQAQREAHHDWHAARRQDERAAEDSGAVVIGR
jgi:hypothetical protein